MPKQKINHSTPLAIGESRFDLFVGWQRDMDVQVGIETGTEADGQRHLVDYVYGDPQTVAAIGDLFYAKMMELGVDMKPIITAAPNKHDADWQQRIGRAVLDAVTGSTPFGTGVWWHPNRSMINRLIRVLRDARDQAFGKDA